MKTKVVTLRLFDELDEEMQEKVVENYYKDINIFDDWYDHIYEDAKNIGLYIESFDLDRHEISANMIAPSQVKKLVMKNHGKDTDTYKTVKSHDMRKKYDDKIDLLKEFKHDLLEDYLSMLRNEYEYLTSSESIIETLRANEYYFNEDGEIDN